MFRKNQEEFLATVEELRRIIFLAGVDAFMMTLVQRDDGYILQMSSKTRGYDKSKAYQMRSEKTRNRRVFKSPEAAFRICQTLGFDSVCVVLAQPKEQSHE